MIKNTTEKKYRLIWPGTENRSESDSNQTMNVRTEEIICFINKHGTSIKPTLYRTVRDRCATPTLKCFLNINKGIWTSKINTGSTTWNHHYLQYQSTWNLGSKSVPESSTLLYSMCANPCKATKQALPVDFSFAKSRETLRLRTPAFNSVSQSKFVLFTRYACKPVA